MMKNECGNREDRIVYRILVDFVLGFAAYCCLGFFSVVIQTLHAFNITTYMQFYLDFHEYLRSMSVYPLSFFCSIILGGDNPDLLKSNYHFVLLSGMFYFVIVSIVSGECIRLFVCVFTRLMFLPRWFSKYQQNEDPKPKTIETCKALTDE